MIRTTVFSAFLLAAAPVAAQEAEPSPEEDVAPLGAVRPFEVTGELTLMSDYRFRGVSRSDEDPAARAGIQIRHESGFYAGARGTTLRGIDTFRARDPAFIDQGDVQLDLYAGYGADLGGGFSLDGGLIYYVFAGGEGATDYAEPHASLSYLIGPVTATAGARYAPSQAATGDEDMLYLFGEVDVAVPFRPWAFTVQAGRQDWGRYGAYWNWSLGVRHHLRIAGLPYAEIGLRYVDTDLPAASGRDAGLVLSVGMGF